MNFKEELMKGDSGYSRLQKYLIYFSCALLFICMFLQFWIDVNQYNFNFAVAIGVFLIFFIYIVSKDERLIPNSNSKSEAIFALIMTIVLLMVVVAVYWNTSLLNVSFVLASSIVNLVVFVPHVYPEDYY